MSLINDALKRVKEAQHKAPPSPALGPQLRPVEPVAAPAHHALGWLLPFALVGVALLTLLLIWELARKENPAVTVRAQVSAQSDSANDNSPLSIRSSETVQPADSAIREAPAAAVPTRSTGLSALSPSNSTVSAPVTSPVPEAPSKASTVQETVVNTNSSAVQPPNTTGQAGNTNAAIAEAQPPQPAPLRLQGVVFSKRPSAVINGKTLFVGDRVREFRVIAITQDTAILVGAGRTNVLSLSE